MMGISSRDSVAPSSSLQLSALGEACARNDLTAIHEILVKTNYKDDENTDNEVDSKLLERRFLFSLFSIFLPC